MNAKVRAARTIDDDDDGLDDDFEEDPIVQACPICGEDEDHCECANS